MNPSELLIRDEHVLDLIESTDTDGDGVFNADRTVNVALIRPCDGRGPGARIYTKEVLEATAPMYSGWASYMNHEDPKARVAARKMRRGPEELAGELRETAWDPAYTTPDDSKYGYEPGAVVGKFMPANELVEQLIRRVPNQLKLSIKAQATKLTRKPRKDGSPGMLVEGIENDPENSSFDLVTAAGAGGHVRSLVESLYDRSNATDGLATALDGVDDKALSEWLGEHRPNILGGGSVNVDAKDLLETPEVKTAIADAVKAGITAALPDALAEREGELRESIREEIGETGRTRTLAAHAKELIEASKLPPAVKTNLLADYGVTVNDDDTVTPHRGLALIESVVDGDGKVTKTAKDVLADSIKDDVERRRNELRESSPSVPIAPGAGADGAVATAPQFGGQGSAWGDRLRARGLDPTKFGGTKPAAAK